MADAPVSGAARTLCGNTGEVPGDPHHREGRDAVASGDQDREGRRGSGAGGLTVFVTSLL